MIPALLRRALVAFTACVALTAMSAAEPAIIAQARAYLGSEEALNGVTSVHYTGILDIGAHADKPAQQLAIEIMLQKPAQQRSVITSPEMIETTALDGYEGWRRVQDAKDTSRWKMDLLNTAQIKSLRANVQENLVFFRGSGDPRATVEDLGAATVDGLACRKIAFVYSDETVFNRYFDTATGRLVLTETQQGEQIREQGITIVGGIKFPKMLVTTVTYPDGSTQKVTITFEKVAVNEKLPASLFAVPSMGGQ